MCFGSQEDVAAALAEAGAVVIHAAGIGRGGVKIRHAEIEGAFDDADGLLLPAMSPQNAFAAEAEDCDVAASRAERATGQGSESRG